MTRSWRMESLGVVPSWSALLSSDDVSLRRVIRGNRGRIWSLRQTSGSCGASPLRHGSWGWVGEVVVGSGMTGRLIARFNSARVRLQGFFWNDIFSFRFQTHSVLDFSYNVFVAFVMKVAGFMFTCVVCFTTLNDCSQLTVVGIIVFALISSRQSMGY